MSWPKGGAFRGHLETTSDSVGAAPPSDGPQIDARLAEFYLGQAGFRATPLSTSDLPADRRRPPETAVGPDSGLARLCTVQAAQLAVLAGTAEALARNEKLDGVLGEVLAACLDMAAISRGVLYVVEPDGHLGLREHTGFPESAHPRLQSCFGHERRLLELLHSRSVCTIPSSDVDPAMGEDLLGQFDVPSMLVVPVMWGDTLQGTLLLGAPRTDASAEESIAFARVLGLQVAQAMALARTFDRMSQAEHRYRTLMEGAHDAVAVLTPKGRILEVNRRWEDILQLPRNLIEGRHIRDFSVRDSDDRHISDFRRSIDSPSEVAFALRRNDGTTLLMEISHASLEVAGERLVLSIGRDVTEQVRGRAQLMLSDRLASVGMLASGVAHEINNPLAAVITNLELASREIGDLARVHGPLDDLEDEIADARRAAERVRLIVKDLGIFARQDEGGRGPVDVRVILDSALRMAGNEIRQRARAITEYRDVPSVLGNESRLGQVFLNVISNAVQSFGVGPTDRNEILIGVDLDATGWVVVEVRDTGSGMPPEVLARLFTPFFTTKPVGEATGLGLTICQQIVNDCGGDISVESEVGRGTTIRVRLPPAPPRALDDRTPTPLRARRRRSRILIVDDEPLVMRSLQRYLADDYDVVALGDGQAALDSIRDGARYDVIVSDLVMPRMSGMELHAALTELVPDQAARMLFLTGGGASSSGDTPPESVDKPIDGKVLKRLIQERIGLLGPRQGNRT